LSAQKTPFRVLFVLMADREGLRGISLRLIFPAFVASLEPEPNLFFCISGSYPSCLKQKKTPLWVLFVLMADREGLRGISLRSIFPAFFASLEPEPTLFFVSRVLIPHV
jgi:hypothetical protein